MSDIEPAANDTVNNEPKLSADPEWSVGRLTVKKDIISSFAKMAVRLSPYPVPENLEVVLACLDASLSKNFKWNGAGTDFEWLELSLCDIRIILHDILDGFESFTAWNNPKNGSTPSIRFVSAHDGPNRDPDNDFVDLNALIHQTAIEIRNERREFDAFNRKFEAEYGNKANGTT